MGAWSEPGFVCTDRADCFFRLWRDGSRKSRRDASGTKATAGSPFTWFRINQRYNGDFAGFGWIDGAIGFLGLWRNGGRKSRGIDGGSGLVTRREMLADECPALPDTNHRDAKGAEALLSRPPEFRADGGTPTEKHGLSG